MHSLENPQLEWISHSWDLQFLWLPNPNYGERREKVPIFSGRTHRILVRTSILSYLPQNYRFQKNIRTKHSNHRILVTTSCIFLPNVSTQDCPKTFHPQTWLLFLWYQFKRRIYGQNESYLLLYFMRKNVQFQTLSLILTFW